MQGKVNVGARRARGILKDAPKKQLASKLQPGRAPGPDGLPAQLYKRCREVLTPLLARVFSAMGGLAQALY